MKQHTIEKDKNLGFHMFTSGRGERRDVGKGKLEEGEGKRACSQSVAFGGLKGRRSYSIDVGVYIL